MDFIETIRVSIQESIEVKRRVLDTLTPDIAKAAEWTIETLKRGNKLIFFGNGGSAADSQHIAAEFIGRFEKERRPFPAIALTVDTSALTALANDYSVETMFSRQMLALGQPGDLAFAISTSGNSGNVLSAVQAAHHKDIRVMGFTGEKGGKLGEICDLVLKVPSNRTARIQESHEMIFHLICEVVDQALGNT